METAVAMQTNGAENIICLLDDIAYASLRLNEVLAETKKQCVLLRTNCRRLRVTSGGINDVLREIKAQWPLVQANYHRVAEIWAGIKNKQAIARAPRTVLPEGLAKLTPRETEVLILIAEGVSSKAIAYRLGISFKTAVCHRTHILAKTNCHESATLVRLAINSGLVKNGLRGVLAPRHEGAGGPANSLLAGPGE